jgi:hypothetical protein
MVGMWDSVKSGLDVMCRDSGIVERVIQNSGKLLFRFSWFLSGLSKVPKYSSY